jgi:4,5-DOPA dioxygenase extradiol
MSLSLPSIFIAHSAPMLALDSRRGGDYRAWGESLPRPGAILVMSAHWETPRPTLAAVETQPLIYDFYGFPDALYDIEYPAPGAPELAESVTALLQENGYQVGHHNTRGLDHGVWVPLLHLIPDASVPVLQISPPSSFTPQEIFHLGQTLAPLREQGILIAATGVLTHNLRQADLSEKSVVPDWARRFDNWVADCLLQQDWEALFDYLQQGPEAKLAHPTPEHFLPLFFAAGAVGDKPARVTFPVEGFEYGSLSRRCVQFQE